MAAVVHPPTPGVLVRRLIPAAAAVLLTAACSSTTDHAAPEPPAHPTQSAPAASRSSTAAGSPTTSAPTAATSTTAGLPANVTLSVQARQLPPGPFNITAISCGPYSPAQQSQFGSNAKGGLVFKYTNMSQSVTGAPSLEVNFLDGSTVLASNVPGSPNQVGPGQSAEAYVDALGNNAQNISFTSCQLMSYGLLGVPGAGPYAP